jgi:hypothetical protein
VFIDDLHAKRVQSLANGALGVMTGAALAVSLIGQALAQARGCAAHPSPHPVPQTGRPTPIDEAALMHALRRSSRGTEGIRHGEGSGGLGGMIGSALGPPPAGDRRPRGQSAQLAARQSKRPVAHVELASARPQEQIQRVEFDRRRYCSGNGNVGVKSTSRTGA